MMRRFSVGGVFILVMLLVGSVAEAAIYDLAADWSDDVNPFGPWKLKKNGAYVFTTNLPDYYSNGTNQRAWADDTQGTPHHVPVWMKNKNNGWIYAHTAEFDRTGTDYTAVHWTSPEAGTVEIQGAIWEGWTSGRMFRWVLKVNGATVSQGDITCNGTYVVTNKFDLADGSGGAGVLTQTVAVDDTIELGLITLSQSGNLGTGAWLDFAIVPEPASLALLAVGGLVLRRRHA